MDAAIRTEKLTKVFGATQALVDLDLEVPTGEVLGYLGPNGAGKTTTIRLLLGLIRPTAGRAEIFGIDDISSLRIMIRSPDGTISDLNSAYQQFGGDRTTNNLDQGQGAAFTDPAGGAAPFIWTFSTNRHWGERSDDFIEIDPITGAPREDRRRRTRFSTARRPAGRCPGTATPGRPTPPTRAAARASAAGPAPAWSRRGW